MLLELPIVKSETVWQSLISVIFSHATQTVALMMAKYPGMGHFDTVSNAASGGTQSFV